MDGYGWIWMDMDGYGWIWMDMDGYGSTLYGLYMPKNTTVEVKNLDFG